MKNTRFKNKVIEMVLPLVATTTLTSTLIYADSNSNMDYTPGNYIIINGNPTSSSANQLPRVSISGGSISYYTYKPGEHAYPFQHYNPPEWFLSSSSINSLITSLGNLAFGVGTGLYQMGLGNPSNLAGIFGEIAFPNEFGNLTLPAILYAVGTYAPVLKEALVGADNISKQMVMFSSQAIDSLQNAINSLPSGERDAVQACISYNLTGGQYAGLSQASLTNYLYNNSQSSFNSIVDSCMQGESIVQSFSGNARAINNYLNQFNPRAYMVDDIQQASLTVGPHGNLEASDTMSNTASLYSLFNPSLLAKDMLIASMPELYYNPSVTNIVPQFVYIKLPNGKKILVSLANFKQDVRAVVNIQMYNTIQSMFLADHFKQWYKQYVSPMNKVLSLSGKDVYNYWYTIYNTYQTYKYAYKHGTFPPPNDDIHVTKKDLNVLAIQLVKSIRNLKDYYILEFGMETLLDLMQDAQENEQKYMAEHEINSKPKKHYVYSPYVILPNYIISPSSTSNSPYLPNYSPPPPPKIPF